MSVPTNNPVAFSFTDPDASPNTGSTAHSILHPPTISKIEYVISGLKTTTFGLAELPPSTTEVAVLWLLHPRLQTQACMAPFAAHLIHSWNSHRGSKNSPKGLIAVSFDQRNHGSREVSAIANEAWRSGNERHAQDMFSCYHGTSVDTSQLLDHLAAYIFPENERQIVQNIVLGISLGGHAAWQCLMQDPRISAAIVVIGCPDYTRLMSDRARLSKRKTWLDTQGREFVGSKDFPQGLVEAIKKFDPAGLLWGTGLEGRRRGQEHLYEELTADEKTKLVPLVARTLGNKRILNLSGGADKLVPYAMGKPFLDWLKRNCDKGGFFEGSGLLLEDIIVPGVGHEVPPQMVEHMDRFLTETLDNETEMTAGKKGRRDSRM